VLEQRLLVQQQQELVRLEQLQRENRDVLPFLIQKGQLMVMRGSQGVLPFLIQKLQLLLQKGSQGGFLLHRWRQERQQLVLVGQQLGQVLLEQVLLEQVQQELVGQLRNSLVLQVPCYQGIPQFPFLRWQLMLLQKESQDVLPFLIH